MKFLITGGAGFVGSHVADGLLAAGHGVCVVDDLSSGDRANVPDGAALHVVDIRDRDALAKVYAEEKPDRVCHQAAQMSVSRSVREPVFDAEVNLLGLLHVCELAREHGCDRLSFASTGGALYGDVDVSDPADEEHALLPARPVRHHEEGRRGLPAVLRPPVRPDVRGPAVQQRLWPPPEPARGGRRGGDLQQAAAEGRADHREW